MMQRFLQALALILAISASPAIAQEKGAVRPGFSAEQLVGQKVLVFRPTVWVGEQSTAGMPEPNADWTAQSRDLLDAELRKQRQGLGVEFIDEPDSYGDDAKLVAQYRSLFTTVAGSVMVYQFFPGNRLPTRKNKPFEWSMGSEISRLGDRTGARYGLFVSTEDQYGSTGRKVFQFLAAGLVGVGVQSGVHTGYAGLVDLKTGELVWLNADGQMGGDVRNSEGMQKRVAQLLEDFPTIAKRPVSAK